MKINHLTGKPFTPSDILWVRTGVPTNDMNRGYDWASVHTDGHEFCVAESNDAFDSWKVWIDNRFVGTFDTDSMGSSVKMDGEL